MQESPDHITVVTTDFIVGEEITETIGYVSSICLSWFIIGKKLKVENALDIVIERIQRQAFNDRADAIINLRTSLEINGQYWGFTRITVFAEGTTVNTRLQ